MATTGKIELLKKAIRNLRSDMDANLSEREKELLKELILKGQVQTEADLRGYVSRLAAAKKRQQERDKANQEKRRETTRQEEEKSLEGATSKITGKVICAKTRRPLPGVKVRVQGTSYNHETEGAGVFIWEEMPQGKSVQFDLSLKGFKNTQIQYKSTLDNEQHLIVKMVPLESRAEKRKAPSF